MGLLDRIGAFDRYKVSPTQGTSGLMTGAGRPMSPFAQQAARNIGGLLGQDMRTPEEKILAATAGIDRTTAAGQLEAIEARLKFETDPDKRNTLGQQAVQLRRQMASDTRTAATEQRRVSRIERVATALENMGESQEAEYVRDGTYSPEQGSSYLATQRRARAINENDIEQQRRLIRSLGYENQDMFSSLYGKDSKPMSQGTLSFLLGRAEKGKQKQSALDYLDSLKSTEQIETLRPLVENGFLDRKQVGAFLAAGIKSTKPEVGSVVGADGSAKITSTINGVYSTLEKGEWVPVSAENPVFPIIKGETTVPSIKSSTGKTLETILETEDLLPDVMKENWTDLPPAAQFNFNVTVMRIAEERAKLNKTSVQQEMIAAFKDVMSSKYMSAEEGWYDFGGSSFVVPDLSEFIERPAAPSAPAATSGEKVVPWGS